MRAFSSNVFARVRPPRATLPTGDVRLPSGELLRQVMPFGPVGFAYVGPRKMRVIATEGEPGPYGSMLHVSASYADHLPSYDDMAALKEAFYGPDRDVMQVFPCRRNHVNIHPFTLHLWEMPEAWVIGEGGTI